MRILMKNIKLNILDSKVSIVIFLIVYFCVHIYFNVSYKMHENKYKYLILMSKFILIL